VAAPVKANVRLYWRKLMRPIIFVLGLMAFGISTASEKQAIEENARLLNQHVVASVLLAMYYCENERWPKDLATLHDRWEGASIPLPVQPEWELLGSEKVEFVVSDHVFMSTPEHFLDYTHAFETISLPPDCNGENIKVNAHTHISSDTPNKGFNRTPESSGPAKPGESGGGAG